MFYDKYVALCQKRGIRPSKAADEIGINRATVTGWKKKGSIPTGEILEKVANYFDISVGDLFERNYPKNLEVFDRRTGKQIFPEKSDESEQKEKAPISDEDLKIALWGHGKISDRALKTVRDYAAFVEEREREEDDENSK